MNVHGMFDTWNSKEMIIFWRSLGFCNEEEKRLREVDFCAVLKRMGLI